MDQKEIQKLTAHIAGLEQQLEKLKADLHVKTRALGIEAALDKVRDRAINMRKSAELSDTSSVLFHQLQKLGINPIRTGVGIFDDANDAMEIWLTAATGSDEVVRVLDYFSLRIHPVFENIIPARQQNKPYSLTVLRGNEVIGFYEMMTTYLSQPKQQDFHQEEFYYSFFFSHGALNITTRQALSDEECGIMIKFAGLFGLIYTRFLDLQDAERRTREAMRKTALDRVRAGITSMRTADDLQRITPLIWRELGALGVPFVRCGVFIMDTSKEIVHTYLSNPEGVAIAVLQLPFRGITMVENTVEHWKQQSVFTEHWNREDFLTWTQNLIDQGYIDSAESYQGGSVPDSLHLHFIPFAQGMLYIGSAERLDSESLDLAQALAGVFANGYARYEDFIRLEAAKKSTEKALADLNTAKDKLVQQEKLASLGQLTAGIAHEIKNPLNFVNNFSEVSLELVEEIRAEIVLAKTQDIASQDIASQDIASQDIASQDPASQRDVTKTLETVNDILDDIQSNLQRIHQHGTRADNIIRSMLMHSRGGSGEMEPVDLNMLIREYINLAFHGMRAGLEPINVTIDLKLDENIGALQMITEDFSRVILNLCNNAFDAMREKLATTVNYQPELSVRTTQHANVVHIEMEDNGPGIPNDIKDKILQPFFTTKKGTQGTGLGLSITNDIVHAHGGTMEIETETGSFSKFLIILPK